MNYEGGSRESQKTNTDPVGFSLSYFHTVSVSFIAHSRMCGFFLGSLKSLTIFTGNDKEIAS